MAKIIIGLVGQAGCGKGTVADYLREKYKAGYFRFSAILSAILDKLALEITRENQIKCSQMVRQIFGEDILSRAISKDVLQAPEDIVIVDGIRLLPDIAALEPLPQFRLIAVDAPARTRYERIIQRGEKAREKDMTWEQFQREEQAPTEVVIPAIMARASHTLSNAGTREELEQQIDRLMALIENKI